MNDQIETLRLKLLALAFGDVCLIHCGERVWTVEREPHRYKITSNQGGRAVYLPPKSRAGTISDFRTRRAVAGILALVYGSDVAPELNWPHVARYGYRYAAYDFNKYHARLEKLAVFGDTPEAATEEYQDWKSANSWFERGCRS